MASSDGDTVEVGRLRFKTHYRHFGADQGPAVEVYAEVKPGQWREVARYDCFVQDPHRHFFYADGKEDRKNLGTATVAESVCVCVDELRASLPAILQRIGYPELGAGLGPEVQAAVDRVDTHLRAFPG
jgi:hypothetical protein